MSGQCWSKLLLAHRSQAKASLSQPRCRGEQRTEGTHSNPGPRKLIPKSRGTRRGTRGKRQSRRYPEAEDEDPREEKPNRGSDEVEAEHHADRQRCRPRRGRGGIAPTMDAVRGGDAPERRTAVEEVPAESVCIPSTSSVRSSEVEDNDTDRSWISSDSVGRWKEGGCSKAKLWEQERICG